MSMSPQTEPRYFYEYRQKALVDEALAKLPVSTTPQATHEVLEGLATRLQQLRDFERCALERTGPVELKRNYRQTAILQASRDAISCCCVLGDGQIVSGDHYGVLRVWEGSEDGSWGNTELAVSAGMIERVFGVPGGGFASVSVVYSDDFGVEDMTCCLWRQQPDGEWQGSQLPLGQVNSMKVYPLPDGKLLSFVDGRAEVWRDIMGGDWKRNEIARGMDCVAVLPDGRIVAANSGGAATTSGIQLFTEQADSSWSGQKIDCGQIHGAKSMSVLRSGKLVVNEEDAYGSPQVGILSEAADGVWEFQELYGFDSGGVRASCVLPSGVLARGSGMIPTACLWSEQVGGQWRAWRPEYIDIDTSNLRELPGRESAGLPSLGFAELAWGQALLVWQRGEGNEWARYELWRAAENESVLAYEVLSSGDIVLIVQRSFWDASVGEKLEQSLVRFRPQDDGHYWEVEEAPVSRISGLWVRGLEGSSNFKMTITALPDGKLALRPGNEQILIFDGDPVHGDL